MNSIFCRGRNGICACLKCKNFDAHGAPALSSEYCCERLRTVCPVPMPGEQGKQGCRDFVPKTEFVPPMYPTTDCQWCKERLKEGAVAYKVESNWVCESCLRDYLVSAIEDNKNGVASFLGIETAKIEQVKF